MTCGEGAHYFWGASPYTSNNIFGTPKTNFIPKFAHGKNEELLDVSFLPRLCTPKAHNTHSRRMHPQKRTPIK